MDPITIATASFAALKTGISVGKDLQSLGADIGKMWGAIDQIKADHSKERQKRRGTVEEEALKTFLDKKKAEDLEDALRQIIYATRGINAWNELVRLRAQIRKERLAEIERRRKRNRQIVEIVLATIALILGAGLMVFIIYMVIEARNLRGM